MRSSARRTSRLTESPARKRGARSGLGRPLWGKRKVLARGMVGWDVSVLEFFLARRNLGPGVVDGRFTDRTAGAVRRLQRKKNLAVDGVVGPRRWPPPEARATQARRRPPTMLAVQHSLKRWARYYGVSFDSCARSRGWSQDSAGTQSRRRAPGERSR